MTRVAVIALGVGLGLGLGLGACGDTTDTAPTSLNLNRPIDVSFACFGGLRITGGGASDPSQQLTQSAQPTPSCDVRSGDHDTGTPTPRPPGQEDLPGANGTLASVSWYAFILQSVPGTVTLGRFDTKPASGFTGGDVVLLDSDPFTPGTNGISVGEDPVGIATSPEGCFEVIPNAGSCDISELDVGSAVAGIPNEKVDRFQVKNAAGQPILSKPAAIVAQPPTATDAIGVACPAQASGLVYIAYPSCHLVAEVDLGTMTIVGGIQLDATGTPSLLTDGNVTCPVECGAGAAATPGARPSTLDLWLDPRVGTERLAIGDDTNVISIVELDPGTAKPLSLAPSIVLEQDPTKPPIAVTSIAITPQIGMGGSSGVISDTNTPGGQSQFVYAVATDNTVRVADILSLNKECDTQVDPRFLHSDTNIPQLSCLVVGAASTPPRRPGAHGPGLTLTGHAIPTSVNIYKVDFHGMSDPNPAIDNLIGYFGVITAADGASFLLNINDDNQADDVDQTNPLATMVALDVPHQLRDGINGRGDLAQAMGTGSGSAEVFTCDDAGPDPDSPPNTAGARSTTPPILVLPTNGFSPTKAAALPDIRQQLCVGPDEPSGKPVSDIVFSASVATRDLTFPDLRALWTDETWTMTWEGPLSADVSTTDTNGPEVRESQMFVDATDVRIDDQTRPFCNAGVEPFDIVQIRGCDPSLGNADCPLGYVCFVHPQSQVTGIGSCMLSNESDRLANACEEYLLTERTYTVGKATTGELTLLPRKHELLTTPLDGCTSDPQCQSLAKYALQLNDGLNPVDDHTPDDPHTWKCAADPARAPLAKFPGLTNTGNRCIETCTTDADCVPGTVCQLDSASGNNYCMEGVVPPQACVNAPQRYELQAAEAFTLLGTHTGYIHPIIADTGGNCVTNPTASPWQIGRLRLAPRDATGNLSQCDPTADPRTGQRPDGTFEPNPCALTTTQTDVEPSYVPGSCSLASPGTKLVTRPDPTALRFRDPGMTLTLVDTTYPGDAMCIGDRGGAVVNVPTTPPGMQLSFRITAGFTPEVLQIDPALPIKAVRGPTNSIWVVDEGDFESETIDEASTLGRVYRVEPSNLTIINVME